MSGEAEIRAWSTEQVILFLRKAIPALTDADVRILERQQINGQTLLRITQNDLKGYGLAGGPVIGIMEAVDHLKVILKENEQKQGPPSQQPPPQPSPQPQPQQQQPPPAQPPSGDTEKDKEIQRLRDEVARQRVLLLAMTEKSAGLTENVKATRERVRAQLEEKDQLQRKVAELEWQLSHQSSRHNSELEAELRQLHETLGKTQDRLSEVMKDSVRLMDQLEAARRDLEEEKKQRKLENEKRAGDTSALQFEVEDLKKELDATRKKLLAVQRARKNEVDSKTEHPGINGVDSHDIAAQKVKEIEIETSHAPAPSANPNGLNNANPVLPAANENDALIQELENRRRELESMRVKSEFKDASNYLNQTIPTNNPFDLSRPYNPLLDHTSPFGVPPPPPAYYNNPISRNFNPSSYASSPSQYFPSSFASASLPRPAARSFDDSSLHPALQGLPPLSSGFRNYGTTIPSHNSASMFPVGTMVASRGLGSGFGNSRDPSDYLRPMPMNNNRDGYYQPVFGR